MELEKHEAMVLFCSQAVRANLPTCVAISLVSCGLFLVPTRSLHGQIRPIQLTPSATAPAAAGPQSPNIQSPNTLPPATTPTGAAPPTGTPATGTPATGTPATGEGGTPPSGDAPVLDSSSLEGLLQLVAQRQQQLTADTELTPEVREQLTKSYAQTRGDLEAALKARQRRSESTAAAAAAPAVLELARGRKAELDDKKSSEKPEQLQYLGFEELDKKRLALEAELATVTAERTALTDSLAKRESRRKDLPQLISDTKAKLEQLNLQAAGNGNGDVPALKEASGWSLEATKKLLVEQQQSFEAEQRLYEAEALLLPLQLELAQASEKRLQDQLRAVNEQLDKIRTNRILATYSQVKQLIEATPSDMQPFGTQLLKRIEAWMEMANKQAQIKAELDDAKKLLARWSERRSQMNGRVEPPPGSERVSSVITGFNSWVGLMLRKQRGELPDTRQLEAKIRELQVEMQTTESLLFEIEDASQDIKVRQETLEAQAESTSNGTKSSAVAELLKFSETALQTFKLDVNNYQNDLYQLADVRDNTIRLANDYRDFIDKHVLWIRSTDQLGASDWSSALEAFRWLVDLRNWTSIYLLLGRDVIAKFGWYLIFLVAMCMVIFNQTRLRRILGDLSAKADKNNCTSFRLTARSAIITFWVTAPLPMILLFFAWRIGSSASLSNTPTLETDFAASLANGLKLTAAVFFPLELLRQLCRPLGLGIKHFGWKEKSALRLRANLRWFIDFCIPLTIIIGMFLNHSAQRWEASFGRAAFILLMPLLSLFLARVFAPRGGIVSGFLESHVGGWWDRLTWVWYPLLTVLPMALAAVSFVGYHYTAQRIAFHMIMTLWTIVLITLIYCLLMRWLVLNRRRLMLAQARQRLEEAARREPQSETQGESQIAAEEPRIDLVAINEQTRRLVSSLLITTGFILTYLTWSDVLPAVSMLEEIRLWPLQGDLTDESFTITLASVLLVIPITVLIIIIGRNAPGLLEIAFLQHLPLTSAARYAITTLSRYAIFAIGIVIVASIIGLRWTSIQWLVAALGVGLGFGLQEIFANFVSGIILLFEQPIRVGDIITIDGTTGTVNRIRMRATTIINWDRQELIVPNKDLITGKLLNWTLTDSTNRIVINVGVAYGSDTQRACEIIMDVCRKHANVLAEPRPSVTFESFGDNTLNLVLRAFLDALENRLVTIHEMHQQIYRAFGEAGIEIAFPQRDLHIRSLPDNWNRWLDRKRRDSPE